MHIIALDKKTWQYIIVRVALFEYVSTSSIVGVNGHVVAYEHYL